MSKTFIPKNDLDQRKWRVIDAEGAIVGRLAVQIANVLRGRDKAIYTPHLDTGDFVVVVNAEKVRLTGRKMDQKVYYRYSGFIGGMKETVAKTLLAKKPTDMLMIAVRGMLPKNSLGRRQLKKLKLYAGDQHPHSAQNPEKIELL